MYYKRFVSVLLFVCYSVLSKEAAAFQAHGRNERISRPPILSSDRIGCFAEPGEATDDVLSNKETRPQHIVFLGGGIFFYWQAGVVTFLRENGYDLSQTSATGASAGALTATLTACDVDFYQATDLALQMAKDAGVWDRSGGLQGIWGPMIRTWLDELLPENAVARMQARQTSLLVTPVPQLAKHRVSSFTNRNDLIDCNMASVHLPLFLDGEWISTFRGTPCIDGSFLSSPCDYEPTDKNRDTIRLSHRLDEKYGSQSLLTFVKAISTDGIYEMIEDGKKYAKRMEEQGKLSAFPLLSTEALQSSVSKEMVRRWILQPNSF